jgi:MFS family permease
MLGSITFLPTLLQVANGVSASAAGILLAPQVLGLLGASVLAGQIVSRTGRYRFLPIVGTLIAATGMLALSTLGTDTTHLQSSVSMAIFGCGIGLTLPVIVVATQNESPVEHLGVATATVNFFRAVGSSIGVAIFGALYTSQLVSALGPGVADDATPEGLRSLSPALQREVADEVADAITSVFRWGVPILLVAFVLAWFMREVPLRTTVGDAAALELAMGEEAALGIVDPAFTPDAFEHPLGGEPDAAADAALDRGVR